MLVRQNNRTMVTLSEENMDNADGRNCTWIIAQKASEGNIACTSRYCDISRSDSRRIFLKSKSGADQAVFVTQPDFANDGEIVQVRSTRTSTDNNFAAEAKPSRNANECVLLRELGAQARKDGDEDEGAAASLSLAALAILATVLVRV